MLYSLRLTHSTTFYCYESDCCSNTVCLGSPFESPTPTLTFMNDKLVIKLEIPLISEQKSWEWIQWALTRTLLRNRIRKRRKLEVANTTGQACPTLVLWIGSTTCDLTYTRGIPYPILLVGVTFYRKDLHSQLWSRSATKWVPQARIQKLVGFTKNLEWGKRPRQPANDIE